MNGNGKSGVGGQGIKIKEVVVMNVSRGSWHYQLRKGWLERMHRHFSIEPSFRQLYRYEYVRDVALALLSYAFTLGWKSRVKLVEFGKEK